MEVSNRHAKVKSLFLRARELGNESRGAFLDEACAGDTETREQVERLLRQDTHTGAELLPHSEQLAREQVGRYRLVRKLGQGGMGTVFEAEQPNPKRLVALKVMNGGRFASEYSVKLFEREIQALARLKHSGIASIHEAGCTEDGHHFFTMELVGGETLAAFLKRKRPGVREAIALFLKICDAVTYAHQHGVIHRDLKPSNIMVSESAGLADIKVLDFGLARIHDDGNTGEALTHAGSVQGTLAYMSPEQASGNREAIDLRTDVYALGVILYEMLSGRQPIEVSGLAFVEAMRAIQEQPPVALASGLDRDVCTIVHKALEKDPARRYASASGMSDDLRRYLNNEPILARPASTWYELTKLVSRHKLPAAFAASLFVLIVGFAVATTMQARRIALERDRAVQAERLAQTDRNRAVKAESLTAQERNRALQSESAAVNERNRALAEKRRADTEAETAKAISEFLQRDLIAQAQAYAQASPNTRPDPNLPVRVALDRAASKIDGRFAKQPAIEAAIRYTIGTTYWNLGLLAPAEQQLAKALEIRQHLLGDQHPDTMASTNSLGLLYLDESKYQQARPLLEQTLDMRKRLLGENHVDTSVSMNNLGRLYRILGMPERTEALYKKVFEIRRRALGEEHPSTSVAMNNLGYLYYSMEKYKDAELLLLRALDVRLRTGGEDHPNTAGTRTNLGLLYYAQGRYAEAERYLKQGYESRLRAFGEKHANTLDGMTYLGLLYFSVGRFEEAETLIAKRVELGRRADTVALLADIRIARQRYSEAKALLAACGAGATWETHYCESLRGAVLVSEGRFDLAEPLLVSGYEGMKERKDKMPMERRIHVVQAGERVVKFFEARGRAEVAAQWREKLSR